MQEFTGFDNLDLTDVSAGSNHLKAGQYVARVTAASVELNKARTGRFVQVKLATALRLTASMCRTVTRRRLRSGCRS